MNRRAAAVGIVAALVLLGGAAAALYMGVGPAPGGDSGDEIEEFPTETEAESDGDDADGEDGDDTTAEDDPPFTFTVDEIEECGQTCRDVTATVHNEQPDDTNDVNVYTRIYAGEDNTDSDDIVWEGTEAVGTLEAETAHTSTRRVELSLQDARKIDNNDGWVTIVTTVESDEETVTFQDSEQVA